MRQKYNRRTEHYLYHQKMYICHCIFSLYNKIGSLAHTLKSISIVSYISFLHKNLESLKKSAAVEFVNSDCSPKVTIFTKKVIFMVTY